MTEEKINVLKDYKIGVLAGGPSSEREISLKSGKAVFEALSSIGLDPVFIDVTEDNFLREFDASGIDLAFIALHGHFGEDGTVQKLLDGKGIMYTGSGPESSHDALDKMKTKEKFATYGIKTPEYKVFTSGDNLSKEEIWSPCVIKPSDEGSSIGLSIVFDPKDMQKAFELALEYSEEVLVEEFISGREMTVGILDDKPLPVVEIITGTGVYDFDAKYNSSDTKYIAPANIDDNLSQKVQEIGIRAHKSLGCSGFSRVDLRVTDSNELYVLEVNTIPGLTERSLLPMAAKAAGMDFTELCVNILIGAIKD